MPPTLAHTFLLVSLFALTLTMSANAATRFDLVIDESHRNRQVPWPVTTGVPFPKGKLIRPEQCRLLDSAGQEQPLQVKVAAHWEAARTSIRWLTIDFIAQPGKKYALEFGPDIARRDGESLLRLKDGETVKVDTGPLSTEFLRTGPFALGNVCIDLNGDGEISGSEVVAAGPSDGDHFYLDEKNHRSSSERDANERNVVVETNGKVRACVRVDGWYTQENGKRIVKYRTRYHLFAGLPLIKMVDEFRIVGSTRDTQFRDIALTLDMKLSKKGRLVSIAGLPHSDNRMVSHPWRDETQSISSVQETYRHLGNQECRGQFVERSATSQVVHQTGDKVGDWLQVSDDTASITGSLRWFWQQFPKQWEATEDRLTLHLWSPLVEPLDFGEAGLRGFFGPAGNKYLLDWKGTREPQTPIENFFFFAGRHALERDGADGLGINKHHEVLWHFARAEDAKKGAEYGSLVSDPPLCLATGEWNCSTGVFGPLAARPNSSKYEAIVDRIFELERYAQDSFGDYGWWLFGSGPHYSYQWDAEAKRHYADPRRFEYHTYQRETQLWWCYLRSGERKFYDWAIPSENHWVDIAVTHVPTKFSTQWRGGTPGNATLHFPTGDWSIDSPLHYVRHHDTGEAWLRSASQYWASYHRTLETTTLAYFLTGDERYNDVIQFWREYWSALAGIRSDSTNVQPWHREQMWFQPTAPGQPNKTWAEMLRDYAPFQSGSRHQMTLFFNLATLYEHTWDPILGKVLDEYAAVFIDPKQPNGVWQCQDHRLPANADSPMLSHYWASALWKYARVTNDTRMPDILNRYFTAAYHADPYGEDVGIYSNVQIAYAWHFTRDPRHLTAAVKELDDLLPNAEPLQRPEELGGRIYNPGHPIKALAATPRLIAALADAERSGIRPPVLPLTPQRAWIAVRQKANHDASLLLWGWDREIKLLDPATKRETKKHSQQALRSHRVPFDRVLPNHAVYETTFHLPRTPASVWYFLNPSVETGILTMTGCETLLCNASDPLRIEPRQRWTWQIPAGTTEMVIESATPLQWRVSRKSQELTGKVVKNVLTIPLIDVSPGETLTLESRASQPIWFRMVNGSFQDRWLSPQSEMFTESPPSITVTSAPELPPLNEPQPTYVPGRFGQAVLMVPGRELQIPDEITEANGTTRRLADLRQGTFEFWVQRWWDERLVQPSQVTFLTNGPLQIHSPWKLPLREWAHVAIVWRPAKNNPEETWSHVYVNGVDFASYRSLYWQGYARPPNAVSSREWLKKFVSRVSPGIRYAIDDIRLSSIPRYFDPNADFGRQQTFNPFTFSPPLEPMAHDDHTVFRFTFDNTLAAQSPLVQQLEAQLIREKK